MRFVMVLVAACVCMHVATTAVAQQFPYTLKVAAETPYYGQAKISGPAAGQLPAGSAMEVYRHDGEWLAIRPPAGSYSWVSTRDVEATNQSGVVRVRAGSATCWVGHTGTENRTVSQVSLEQGELLQVVGDSLEGNETEVQQWYRVAPPAGEFRFVHSRHVNNPPAPAPIGTGVSALSAGWSSRGSAVAAPKQVVPSESVTPPVANNSMPMPTPMPLPVATQAATNIVASSVSAVSTTQAAARERLTVIDSHLATMLAYPPNMWNPQAVVPELQTLMASAPTAELRAQAQKLLEQALRSQQVQQGYAQVAAGIQTSVQPAAYQVPAAEPVPQPAAQQAVRPASYYVEQPSPYSQGPLGISPEFRPLAPRNVIARMREAFQPGGQAGDYGRGTPTPASQESEVIDWPVDENGHAGTGWLMPLVERSQLPIESRAGVPPLALTDDEGNVQFLVTPAPGSSMREYLRKEVGIVGPVSKLPDLETPHITAQRVVVLNRHE